METEREKHNIIAKRHRDRKKEYYKNLEKENKKLKLIIQTLASQMETTNKFISFLSTPLFFEKKR